MTPTQTLAALRAAAPPPLADWLDAHSQVVMRMLHGARMTDDEREAVQAWAIPLARKAVEAAGAGIPWHAWRPSGKRTVQDGTESEYWSLRRRTWRTFVWEIEYPTELTAQKAVKAAIPAKAPLDNPAARAYLADIWPGLVRAALAEVTFPSKDAAEDALYQHVEIDSETRGHDDTGAPTVEVEGPDIHVDLRLGEVVSAVETEVTASAVYARVRWTYPVRYRGSGLR